MGMLADQQPEDAHGGREVTPVHEFIPRTVQLVLVAAEVIAAVDPGRFIKPDHRTQAVPRCPLQDGHSDGSWLVVESAVEQHPFQDAVHEEGADAGRVAIGQDGHADLFVGCIPNDGQVRAAAMTDR